ncbi:MAG: hypothetical protein C4297_06160 [Gemmataceae bacterium]
MTPADHSDSARPHKDAVWSLLQAAKAGDKQALNTLFEVLAARLQVIVRYMFKHFPDPALSSSDAVQEAALQLYKSLDQVPVLSERQFMAFASRRLRWALLTLLRRCKGSIVQSFPSAPSGSQSTGWQPAATTSTSPEKLEAWEQFHAVVENGLEDHEREVVDLYWYWEFSHKDIADVLGVSERTVKRYWRQAKEKIKARVDPEALK